MAAVAPHLDLTQWTTTVGCGSSLSLCSNLLKWITALVMWATGASPLSSLPLSFAVSCTHDQSAVRQYGEDNAYAAAEIQACATSRRGKQRQSEEMMALYKRRRLTRWAVASADHPDTIFTALYYMLMGSITELRHAPPFALDS